MTVLGDLFGYDSLDRDLIGQQREINAIYNARLDIAKISMTPRVDVCKRWFVPARIWHWMVNRSSRLPLWFIKLTSRTNIK